MIKCGRNLNSEHCQERIWMGSMFTVEEDKSRISLVHYYWSVFNFIPIWESCRWISGTVCVCNLVNCHSYKGHGSFASSVTLIKSSPSVVYWLLHLMREKINQSRWQEKLKKSFRNHHLDVEPILRFAIVHIESREPIISKSKFKQSKLNNKDMKGGSYFFTLWKEF